MAENLWKIDSKLVERISKNARLNLSEEEKNKFVKQLDDILSAFREIDQVNTEKVKPSFHPQPIKNVFREDEAKKWTWDPLANATHKEKKYFKGPRIV